MHRSHGRPRGKPPSSTPHYKNEENHFPAPSNAPAARGTGAHRDINPSRLLRPNDTSMSAASPNPPQPGKLGCFALSARLGSSLRSCSASPGDPNPANPTRAPLPLPSHLGWGKETKRPDWGCSRSSWQSIPHHQFSEAASRAPASPNPGSRSSF